MKNRADMLSLIAEMRGRLDEMERLVRFGPEVEVMSPAAFDDPDIEILTPPAYRDFRTSGLGADPVSLPVFTPFNDFVQFGSPAPGVQSSLTAFPLSELHRDTTEPAFGLRMVPDGKPEDWFTYEFLLGGLDLMSWEWTEWVLKLSFAEPVVSPVQFILDGRNRKGQVDFPPTQIGEFASFQHLRLPRAAILEAMQGDAVLRARLVLGTGGNPVPLSLHSFAVYGKRG